MSDFRIFVVDDEEMMTDLMDTILSAHFPVEIFSSSEACLERLEVLQLQGASPPGLIVLDVGLPGISGYECCRMIKEMQPDLPVLFVSGHDTIDARIEGYDAGGEDFVVKPFDNSELMRKVRVFARLAEKKQSLTEQVAMSEQLSSLALASMDESGLVLQFLSKAIACATPDEVAEALLHLVRGYRRSGAVQLRCGGIVLNRGSEGGEAKSSPLESSVLDHVRTLGRMFEFKSRSVFNFDQVTVMISNMPVDDPDFRGRIRDNLTIAAQGADARLATMEIEAAERRRFEANQHALQSIKATIADLSAANLQHRQAGAQLTQEMQEALVKSFVHLGLTDNQERYLTELVQQQLEQLVAIFDRSEDTQKMLAGLMLDLEGAAG